MSTVRTSLAKITTGYTIFEKDQVLTHDQLNGVADYFDDQTRLTRIKLLGVGIVCGLRVSVEKNTIEVTRGAGVTTDGDLLYFAEDTVFDKFKLYDESNPKYAPFFVGEDLMTIYELVAKGTTDERAIDLAQFNTESDTTLDSMVAVLLMESYEKDEDLCSGTDCDNLGQSFVNTIKLLLIDNSSIGPLAREIATPAQAAFALSQIPVERPLIPAGVTSATQLSDIYRNACNAIHARLSVELSNLYPECASFLGDVFTEDPVGGCVKKLNDLQNTFAAGIPGIQYYYDFLKNVAETWNAFHELLFGDTTWCCPDSESFPKHLLLGFVMPPTITGKNPRTGFYPSPLASRTIEQLNHALFLARKLDTLIRTFEVPASATTIRITPSKFEDDALEERAIPYYYQVNSTNPIQQVWNHRLHQQGRDDWNYSYNGASYSTQAAVTNPLAFQIGPFPFFRIEGHLGQNVSTAVASIEGQISAMNLPFVVKAVLLGADQTKVVKKPGTRYTDLHRLHQVFRTDLAYQLEDAKTFSTQYKQASDALTASDVDDPVQIKTIARQRNDAIVSGATTAQNVLKQSYSSYRTNPTWKQAVDTTMTTAAQFRQNLGNVTRMEYATPFDTLISTKHSSVLDWLDTHIKDKESKEDAKLLFSKFQSMNPGLEHFAGVLRGGTFVLVYDASNVVVADFMLPYQCCEAVEEEAEPTLSAPSIDTSGIIKDSIKVIPTIDKYFAGKLNTYTQDVVTPKFTQQQDYFTFFKDSWGPVTEVLTKFTVDRASAGGTVVARRYADEGLNAATIEAEAREQKVEFFRQKATDPSLPTTEREKYTRLAQDAENDQAKSITLTTRYIADSGMDVSSGSEGAKALQEMSSRVGRLTDSGAKDVVKGGLLDVQNQTTNEGLKVMIGRMATR
jgi:hypothetical protein